MKLSLKKITHNTKKQDAKLKPGELDNPVENVENR
jgi:hypothetical protein